MDEGYEGCALIWGGCTEDWNWQPSGREHGERGELAEHDVLAIQPPGLGGVEEELGTVGVEPSVGHGQDTRAGVFEGEVLVLELVAVD